MPNQYRSGDKFHDISAIDSRLADPEQEKQQLIALREQLQKTKLTPPVSDSFSPEQKIAIFRSLFRSRNDIFANRWQNQQGRSGYSVACNNEWVKGTCNKVRRIDSLKMLLKNRLSRVILPEPSKPVSHSAPVAMC